MNKSELQREQTAGGPCPIPVFRVPIPAMIASGLRRTLIRHRCRFVVLSQSYRDSRDQPYLSAVAPDQEASLR